MNAHIVSSSPLQRVSGSLQLHFIYDQPGQRTCLVRCEQTPPLQVVHAFPQPHGGTLLHLHNLSGGILSGDMLTCEIEIGPQACVQLTTTSATRIYRQRTGYPPAQQHYSVRIQSGGRLEYVPDQIIPFADSLYQQFTSIELAEDAGLFWWETLAPGRLARGESFAYKLLQLETEITANGLPVFCERFRLEPHTTSLSSFTRLGRYLYTSSFLICRVGIPLARWMEMEQELTALALQLTQAGKIVWGVSSLVAHGLLVRGVSMRGYDILPGLLAFWQAAKHRLYGEDATPPRKIY